ncbi:MAG: putative signal transducing protein [Rhodospirillales bacterium]
MEELVRTNDPVLISWLTAALRAEGVEAVVLDSHASVLEGSAAAIPRRVMVIAEDLDTAKQVLAAADELARPSADSGADSGADSEGAA